MLAASQHFQGIFRDRLFDKTGGCEAAILDGQVFLNIAIGGAGHVELYAKSNQPPSLCHRSGSAHRVDKDCRIENMVIRQIKNSSASAGAARAAETIATVVFLACGFII